METNINIPRNISPEMIWALFHEIGQNFKETDRKFQETDRKFQESERLLTEKFRETDKAIKNLSNLFSTQWGKLMEALVEPSSVRLFQERGINIEQSMTNVKAKENGRDAMECDILLVNETELVVIEVKTTFRPDDVKELAEKLEVFKNYFPRYSPYKVYGATAALRYDGHADKYAYRSGFFVLRSSGEIVSILNDDKFKPKAF